MESRHGAKGSTAPRIGDLAGYMFDALYHDAESKLDELLVQFKLTDSSAEESENLLNEAALLHRTSVAPGTKRPRGQSLLRSQLGGKPTSA
jgi:hypothetical protein